MSDPAEIARQAILKAYPSDSWRKKVEKMSDSQAVAIFMRLRAQGKI